MGSFSCSEMYFILNFSSGTMFFGCLVLYSSLYRGFKHYEMKTDCYLQVNVDATTHGSFCCVGLQGAGLLVKLCRCSFRIGWIVLTPPTFNSAVTNLAPLDPDPPPLGHLRPLSPFVFPATQDSCDLVSAFHLAVIVLPAFGGGRPFCIGAACP